MGVRVKFMRRGHRTEFDRGGHFSGLEVPDPLAVGIREFGDKLQVP